MFKNNFRLEFIRFDHNGFWMVFPLITHFYFKLKIHINGRKLQMGNNYKRLPLLYVP